MTDKEIKKALECHANTDIVTCKNCPMKDISKCGYKLSKLALDYINRLEADKEALIAGQETLQKALAEKNAEIERLKDRNVELFGERNREHRKLKTAKAEAIKEFAERLKENTREFGSANGIQREIDNLVNEMVGDAE